MTRTPPAKGWSGFCPWPKCRLLVLGMERFSSWGFVSMVVVLHIEIVAERARGLPFIPIDHYDPETGGHSGVRDVLDPREQAAIDLARPGTAASNGALLDVGCGTGFFLAAIDAALSLTARGWKLYGIDYSEAQLSEARRYPYEFSRCNVEDRLPFADASLDVVFCGEVIEHLYDPDTFLQECERVIAPGGHLIITTPNLQSWYNRVLFALGIQPLFYETSTRSTHVGAGPLRRLKRGSVPVGHVRLFNRRALRDLLESQGFRPLAERGSIFSLLPAPLRLIDRLFSRTPSLSSDLVIVSERVAAYDVTASPRPFLRNRGVLTAAAFSFFQKNRKRLRQRQEQVRARVKVRPLRRGELLSGVMPAAARQRYLRSR